MNIEHPHYSVMLNEQSGRFYATTQADTESAILWRSEEEYDTPFAAAERHGGAALEAWHNAIEPEITSFEASGIFSVVAEGTYNALPKGHYEEDAGFAERWVETNNRLCEAVLQECANRNIPCDEVRVDEISANTFRCYPPAS